jgi:thiol:disulfide interchange protein DsbD
MLDSDGNLLKDATGNEIAPLPAEYHIPLYIKFLDSGISAYKK